MSIISNEHLGPLRPNTATQDNETPPMASDSPTLPACPGPECKACNGEACDMCGAGCWSNRRDCDHDVLDRHEYGGPVTNPEKGSE